jgi:hypothetical protein
MKIFIITFLVVVSFSACNNRGNNPDVSSIKMEIPVSRFDQQFFSIDTTKIETSLANLREKFPSLLPVYLGNILGLTDSTVYAGVKRFVQLNKFIADSVNKIYKNTNDLKRDFEQAFRYVKYYFPEYKVPGIITIIGPVDLLAETANGELTPDFLGNDFLGISLQFYLGKDFPMYHDEYFVANVAPEYRSRRFDKKYIVADAMKLITDDIFPDRSRGMGLIGQMIEKGKQWWLLDKFLPETADSIKTGYTGDQLLWCKENEGMIWNAIITNEKNIYTTDPVAIQTYIGEAPYTQVMPPASPGNIGPWVGWQIIKKFVEKNPSLSIGEVMQTVPKKILDEAKYKPK